MNYFDLRLSLPQTCGELQKNGLNKSLTALINPAGSDEQFAPIEVQCDIPGKKTILGKEKTIEVQHCQSLR